MKTELFLPCAQGVEPLLADECARVLGEGASVRAVRGGVVVHGDAPTAMRLNLESRLAQRVLWPLAHGEYRHENDLYELARRVPWREWITPQQTLRVDTTAQRSPLRSLNFASLRIKDAVCDVLREATGARPSVDTRRPDLPLALHLTATHATLYADTSGEALFKRGWRDAGAQKGEAPLKETLAAAMLAAAGWQGRAEDGPLLDPCCGAGTIAIEAAQIACGIAPGLERRFAFERLAPWREHLGAWRALREAARARVHASAVPLYAGDVSFRMTDFATRNAERAGVQGVIEFKTADALQRPPPAAAGTLVLNPPYGERIGAKGTQGREGFEQGEGSSAAFFAALAAHWKRHYAGWTAWVLSPDPKLPGLMRLKESRRVPMWNGPIECRLLRFDMVAGSAREARH
ncbi:MAG TPA: class I SAM-dependent RNA methyltransferase [Burkholderiaceae bacterium]|nr:class I SAM-dependent RNA methyltransferase [Burkholderiaceae bacterium]